MKPLFYTTVAFQFSDEPIFAGPFTEFSDAKSWCESKASQGYEAYVCQSIRSFYTKTEVVSEEY